MDVKSNNQKVKKARKLSNFVSKLGDEEINMFLEVLATIMRQVPAPSDARKSYLVEVEKRLRNNGADFLSKSRSFPIFGLKLLGSDRDGFPIPGFKQQKDKIYPSLFAWYWAELERLSKVAKPSKADVLRAQRCLCVLSFAKMIKCSSVNQIRKALTDFESRIDTDPPRSESELNVLLSTCASMADLAYSWGKTQWTSITSSSYLFFEDGPSLMETLNVDVDLETLPQYVDLGSLSTKPSALKEQPEFPYWFMPQFNIFLMRLINAGELPLFGFKPPPYGKVHVITESAGKLRIICPYNTPFVHSTGLYSRCRSILDRLRQDYSDCQTDGHGFVQREIAKGNGTFVSADLSNMTDDTSSEALSFGLRSLGLSELMSYFRNLPITLPNGKIVLPTVLLMGLRGCFELSSVIHHYVVQRAGIRKYAMVGDDVFFRGDFATYQNAIKHTGWNINRSKTVISKTVAVFCGEMYWFGFRVSPRVPKVSSCFHNGKRRKASAIFSITRCSIEHLNNIYDRRNVAQVIAPFIRLLRRGWSGPIIYELPSKLRGLGLRTSRPGVSLCVMLESRPCLYTALMSIGLKREDRDQNRWFGLPVELTPGQVRRALPNFPALLEKGAIQLDVNQQRNALKKNVSSLSIYDVLEWYYENVRLELHQFQSSN